MRLFFVWSHVKVPSKPYYNVKTNFRFRQIEDLFVYFLILQE